MDIPAYDTDPPGHLSLSPEHAPPGQVDEGRHMMCCVVLCGVVWCGVVGCGVVMSWY
jgi:hypothetical protein